MSDATPFLECELEHGVLVLTVIGQQIEGEALAADIKQEMLCAVGKHGANKVVLDLKNTRYVSSIAFWPLLALKRHLVALSGRLIITGLTGAVHDVFTTTKMVSANGSLNAPFETAPDRRAAVALLAGWEAPAASPSKPRS